MILYNFCLVMTYTISVCTHIFPNKHSLTLLFLNAYISLFHLHLEFFVSCICQVQDKQQITMHCTLTAFKASTYVFILQCISSVLCRNMQIGTVPMFSEEAFISPFPPPSTYLELILPLLCSVPHSNTD